MRVVNFSAKTQDAKYVVKVANRSGQQLNFTLFQPVPPNSPSGCFPLAWFAAPLFDQTNAFFIWQETYGLMWANTGPLQSGKIVRAGQLSPAKPDQDNQATLTGSNGAYRFENITAGPSGAVKINVDPSIPKDTLSVGYAMSAHPVLAVQAAPNISETIGLANPPIYTVAFSSSALEKGQVLSDTAFTNAAHDIRFPANKFGATAVLSSGNTWSVAYQASLVVK